MPHPALPCYYCRSMPRHTLPLLPILAVPCRAGPHLAFTASPFLTGPIRSYPCLTLTTPLLPFLASPILTAPIHSLTADPCPAAPCLTLPFLYCHASPNQSNACLTNHCPDIPKLPLRFQQFTKHLTSIGCFAESPVLVDEQLRVTFCTLQ